MKSIKLFNRSSVALGVLQLGMELALKSRVRLAEVDMHVLDVENRDNIACQTVQFYGFIHPGSAILGSRDKACKFTASVLMVNIGQSWCVAWLEFSSELGEYRIHCEYANCPSSGEVLYPSHLCINRKISGSKVGGPEWDVMDTDSGELTSLPAFTYECKPHTPQISCTNRCGRESPIHFFKKSEVDGRRSWICRCSA